MIDRRPAYRVVEPPPTPSANKGMGKSGKVNVPHPDSERRILSLRAYYEQFQLFRACIRNGVRIETRR